MKTTHLRNLSLVAAAVAAGFGSAAFAQGENQQTEEVQRAAKELERAEDRLDTAQDAVKQREEQLGEAIDEAAKSDEPDSQDSRDRSSARGQKWTDSDWNELVEEHEDLRTFVEALRATGLDETLSSGTAYTVFAPIDKAFDEDREDLLSEDNREELVDLLRAHIVADDVDPDRARTLDDALTVDGDRVDLSVEDDELRVGDAKVVGPDIHRGNLRIYPIDELLDAGWSDVALKDRD